MNVSVTALEQYYNANYFPSWKEISVTLMIVAMGFAVFALAAKNLAVFPEEITEEVPGVAESYEVVVVGDEVRLSSAPALELDDEKR
jgi:hypothetical protein